MGKHHDIESVERVRFFETLIGDVSEWNSHLLERKANPPLVLRLDP